MHTLYIYIYIYIYIYAPSQKFQYILYKNIDSDDEHIKVLYCIWKNVLKDRKYCRADIFLTKFLAKSI